MRSHEDPRERAVVWQRNDDPQSGCTRRWIVCFYPQPLCERGCDHRRAKHAGFSNEIENLCA